MVPNIHIISGYMLTNEKLVKYNNEHKDIALLLIIKNILLY